MVHQIPNIAVTEQNHVAAVTAIAAVRAALWDVLLTPETQTAVAPISGPKIHLHFVHKHGIILPVGLLIFNATVRRW
jgi:hypothetical protein